MGLMVPISLYKLGLLSESVICSIRIRLDHELLEGIWIAR